MPKVPLVLTAPAYTYKTRRLQAGDTFDARTRGDAAILTKILKVARPDYETAIDTDPPAESAKPESDSLYALRAEAEAAGVHVDKRWGEARLRQEIASAARQRPAEAAPQMATHSPTVSGAALSGGQTTVSGAMNIGSTAHPVYRRSNDDS